ncbi:CPBP family intramembrane glutamic endopeptidase [Evansella sp. AB-rgal1]|uniref:CPBP family intramembrane glutamic endopeptidase n=1 Tax=Evansella sp. AB-rgal1 TaxID=3242696 RepID=UPI00359D9EEF
MIVVSQLILITLFVLLFTFRVPKKTPFIYFILLLICILTNVLLIGQIEWKIVVSFTYFFQLLLVVGLGILFYIVDLIILNMIKHNVILLDFAYMLKGRVNIKALLISFVIGLQEEILFRYFLFMEGGFSIIILLLISSILFGINHLTFSKYDMFSKMVLGLVCGIIFILTRNILLSIVLHLVYNYFALKNKEEGWGVVQRGN